jgi:glycosyltransferase involved in cell wall biosynthesis
MLDRCLTSVVKAMGANDELIVVDSASDDPAAIRQVAERHGAKALRCELPGVCRARNAGWRAATAPLLGYTDDDVVVDEGWADAIVAAFAAHPEAAFLTGWTEWPKGTPYPDRPVAVKNDPDPAVLDRDAKGDLGHSANMGIRTEALARLGGWDESLGAGGRFRAAPEADLFDRLFKAGVQGRYDPTAKAWHDQWRGGNELIRLDWGYGIGNGARLSKLVRSDRRRARHIARETLWDWGLVKAVHELRRGYERGAVMALARVAGSVVGFVRGMVAGVQDGHFQQ